MIYKYKSIKPTIAKVYRDLNLQEEDRWVSMIEWAAEALQLIGAHYQFLPKTADIVIDGFKGDLPCDFYSLVQIEFAGMPLMHATGSFDNTDECDDCVENKTTRQFVYTINDSYIYTNVNGTICMSYMAFPVDEENFPLMPDEVYYDEAILAYIVKKLYYPDFLTGKMDMKQYDYIDNTWQTKCMAARGKANMPNVDQMESLKNAWIRLIPSINEHSSFFKNLNFRESINIGKR